MSIGASLASIAVLMATGSLLKFTMYGTDDYNFINTSYINGFTVVVLVFVNYSTLIDEFTIRTSSVDSTGSSAAKRAASTC